jgi:DNA-binding LytR/AlgR family response regulator
MKAKCLIVDDEALARSVLEKYISEIEALELVFQCSNALDALSYIAQNSVDIIFLDINMPELNGLEMIRTLHNAPNIIICTAYSEFALESYEYGVTDYLLKPIKFERFVKAVNRVIQMNITDNKTIEDNGSNDRKIRSIFVKENSIIRKIDFEDILYVESYGNYLKIETNSHQFVVRGTLNEFGNKLPDNLFIRVHKSFIVSILNIKKLEGNILVIGNKEIPVGHLYRNELIKKLKL